MTHSFLYGGEVCHFKKSEQQYAIRKGKQLDIQAIRSADLENTIELHRTNHGNASATHVYELHDVVYAPTGEIFIRFKNTTTPDAIQQTFTNHHLEVVEKRTDADWIVKVTDQSQNPLKVCEALQKNPQSLVSEPEMQVAISFFDLILSEAQAVQLSDNSEPLLSRQWHLEHPGAGISNGAWPSSYFASDIDARVLEAMNEFNVSGQGVNIGITDSGIEFTHPDFGSNKFLDVLDANTGQIYNQPSQNDRHGTSVAGVAAAAQNDIGTIGAAPNAQIVHVRLSATINDTSAERLFEFYLDKNVVAVCNSWGIKGNYVVPTRIREAIQNLAENGRNGLGTCVCFASGNDYDDYTTVSGFAALPWTFSIGGSNSQGYKSSYAQVGISNDNELLCLAPTNDYTVNGHGNAGITTTDRTGSLGYNPNDYTNTFGGTSSACPLVVGIIALIAEANPNLTAPEIKAIIAQTCDKIGTTPLGGFITAVYNAEGWSSDYGYGKINAKAAVELASAEQQQPKRVRRTTAWNLISGELNEGEFEYWQLYLGGTARVALVEITKSMNVDMFISKDIRPTSTDYDHALTSVSDTEIKFLSNLDHGWYWLRVQAMSGSGQYSGSVLSLGGDIS